MVIRKILKFDFYPKGSKPLFYPFMLKLNIYPFIIIPGICSIINHFKTI